MAKVCTLFVRLCAVLVAARVGLTEAFVGGRVTRTVQAVFPSQIKMLPGNEAEISYVFPEQLSLTLRLADTNVTLNMEKNMYMSGENIGRASEQTAHGALKGRLAVYNDLSKHATILVECRPGFEHCRLRGSFLHDSTMHDIDPASLSADSKDHVIRERIMIERQLIDDTGHRATINNDDLSYVEGDSDKWFNSMTDPSRSKRHTKRSRAKRAYADIVDCEVVEVDAIVDNTVYEYFLTLNGNDAAVAEAALRLYITRTYAEADCRLQSWAEVKAKVVQAGVRCDVNCIRIYLNSITLQKTAGESWSSGNPPLFNSNTGQEFLDSVQGLKECQNDRDTSTSDVTHCITRHNIAAIDKATEEYSDRYRMSAYRFGCSQSYNKYSVGIHEAKGDTEDWEIAHNVLHAMGARNDEHTSCDWDASFIMSEYLSRCTRHPLMTKNPWSVSECTVNAICTNVNGLNDAGNNCFEHTDVSQADWEAFEANANPGENYTPDQQCQFRWGAGSTQCDAEMFPEHMCSTGILCSTVVDGNPQCNCYVRVFTGTPCGTNKVCKKGMCVFTDGTCSCHSDCTAANTFCNVETSKCECRNGFYDNGGTCEPKIAVNQPCNDPNACADANAECTTPLPGTCQCKNGYEFDGTNCIKSDGSNGKTCEDCCQPPFVCTKNVCGCPTGQTLVNNQCYDDGLCDECTTTPADTCAAPLQCINGRCGCTGSLKFVNGQCTGGSPGDACDGECVPPLVCNAQNQCECPAGQVAQGGQCYGTGECDTCGTNPDTCTAPLQCNGNNKCKCPPGQRYDSANNVCEDVEKSCPPGQTNVNGNCVAGNIDDECNTNPDSCSDANTVCTAGTPNTCQCKTGTTRDGNVCKVPNGGDCVNTGGTSNCADPNAECKTDPSQSPSCDTTCTCKAGFYNPDGCDNCGGTCVARLPAGGSCAAKTGDCDDPCVEGTNCNADAECQQQAGLGGSCNAAVDCAFYPATKCQSIGGGNKECQCNDNKDYIEENGVCVCDLTLPNPRCA